MSTGGEYLRDGSEELTEEEFECSISGLSDLSELESCLWFKLERKFLEFSCKLNSIDIVNIHTDKRCKLATLKSRKETNNKEKVYWPTFIRCLLALIALKLAISTYRSYRFDFYLFRCSLYAKQDYIKLNNLSNVDHQLQTRIDEAREQLIGVGVLYKELAFFIESWNLFALASIIYLNFCLYLQFGYFGHIHYIFGGIIKNFKAIKRCYLRIALNEVRRLIVSSWNFRQVNINKALASRGQVFGDMGSVRCTMEREKNKHRHLISQLRVGLATGHLAPLTWQLEWLNLLGLINVSCSILFELYTIGLLAIVYVVLPLQIHRGQLHWWQLIRMSDDIITFLISLTKGSFFVPIIIITDIDHLRHINKLIAMINECKLKNEVQFGQMLQSIESQSRNKTISETKQHYIDQCSRQANNNILMVLIHYRISVSLSKSMERTSVVFLVGALFLFFLLPSITLLHGPYINDNQLVRQMFTLVSVGNIMIFNSFVAPMCYLHSRSFDLYKSMSSLLAHSIECQSIVDSLGLANIYDNHLIDLLRRELQFADKMARQFTIVALGVPITYPTFLRLHFWFGLVMLAMVDGLSSRDGHLFGHGFFSDPFGLFPVS